LFYGYVAMVEGIVDRMRRDLAGDGPAVCVATGGLAPAITEETEVIDHVDLDLTLTGLRLVWTQHHAERGQAAPAPGDVSPS
jgi:type III pantothenate kinase